MRNIDEIRGSIKDLILKAENEELLNIQNKESHNLSNESENPENQLSDEILKQINLEVTEFQKAFKENGSEELISQTIRETIKPILHEWLKINLPVIVKEVIDEKINEIEKKIRISPNMTLLLIIQVLSFPLVHSLFFQYR